LREAFQNEDEFNATVNTVNAADFDEMKRGPLTEVWSRIIALRDFVSDNQSTSSERANVFIALAALAYVASPLDLVPDYIPGVGLVDDAAIVMYCFSYLGHKLEPYRIRALEMERDGSSPPSSDGQNKSSICDCDCSIQ
jgi:uncharacterized membrane protein YkvA (DUF1232 family)